MRPVNLIPAEERGDRSPIRTGPMAYLLVGALALALAALTMVVLTDNKISQRKGEITELRQQEITTKARAAQLAPFASFSSLENQRRATIRSLADSRFDWERVMRELARVMPSDVWLTELTGAASGSAASSSATAGSTSTASSGADAIIGPSLQLTGCAAGQEAVASFLSALRDIDGVTRVGLSSSERPNSSAAPTSGSDSSAGGTTDCRTRDFITKFEIVAAFDAVPAPQVPQAAPAAPAAAPSTAASAPSGSSTTSASTTPTSNPGS